MAHRSNGIRRLLLTVSVGWLSTLAAPACSSTSAPALRPTSSGVCSGAPKDGLLVSYSTGTAFNENLAAFEAYADGHVDLHQSGSAPGDGGAAMNGVGARTVDVGAARVTSLLADVESTGALNDAPGCYLYKNDKPVDPDADSGGYRILARKNDGIYDFDVYGPAPSSVDAAAHRLAQFLAEVAKP